IRQYTHIARLRGAVNDGRAFKKLLVEHLHVPPGNIALLENADATCAKILFMIRSHLRDNADIPDGGEATIILYFAGHGSRVDAPANVIAPDGQIEVMCPVDYMTDDVGEVHAIPDYVLNQLLGEIAEKGHNVVVIMDCCHSGPSSVVVSCFLDDFPQAVWTAIPQQLVASHRIRVRSPWT
ncbi:hypothetical protein K438DRAFT_1607354, partial [Mycena galopus ATCC 62051]